MKKLLCSTVIILFCLINKSYSGSHEWVKLAPSKSVIKSMIDLGSIKIGMRGKDLIYNNFGGYTSKGMTNIEFIYKEFALIMPRNYTNFNEFYNNYFFVLKKDKKKFKKGCTPVIEHWACYYGVVAIYDNIIDAHDYLLENVTVNKFKTAILNDKAAILNDKNYLKIINKDTSDETKVADEPSKKKPESKEDENKIVPAGSGSGFFALKDGTVITNYHVIESCELNKVFYKGAQSEALVLSVDKANDIAILKTDFSPSSVFSVSNDDVSLLEDIIVAGYPLGKDISAAIKTHKGVVTSLAGAEDNYSFFQTDAVINSGNSGGPIINQKGNIVGIAFASWVEEGVQGIHFGIKSSILKTFASANGLKFLIPNNRVLSNKELGELITESTVYIECHMTIAKINKMIAEMRNEKSFFRKYKKK